MQRTLVKRAHHAVAHQRGATWSLRDSRTARLDVWDNRVASHDGYSTVDSKLLNDINERVREVLAQSPAADLEKNLRAMMTSVFARLDLVTREEFDVQREVLLRTREKLTRLEAQIAELERRLESSGTPGSTGSV